MKKSSRYINAAKHKKDFKKGKYNRPNQVAQEDEEYMLSWANYIYGLYVCDETYIPQNNYSFEDLRRYGVGKQDKFKYKKIIEDCGDDLGANESYMNINWDIVQIIPKFRDLVRGKMMALEFEPGITAIDSESHYIKTKTENAMKMMVHPQMKELMQKTGLKPSGINMPPGIESQEDLEAYVKLGGIKLGWEIMMRDALQVTMSDSDWGTLKDQLISDTLDLNICAMITYLERKTGKVKLDYVDPDNLLIRPSIYPDHRDADLVGRFKRKTISDLRIETELNEEALYDIAKKYASKNNMGAPPLNKEFNTALYQKNQNIAVGTGGDGGNGANYNNMKVDVLEFFFKGKEVERYVVGNRKKDGSHVFDKVSADSNPKKIKKGKRMEDRMVEYIYRCQWIVGTDYVFDYGKEYGVAREKSNGVKKSVLPIRVYSDTAPSMVERMIPFMDDIQLATLKQRNVMAKMWPGPRMAIDLSGIDKKMKMANKSYSVLDMLSIASSTGVFFYDTMTNYDDPDVIGTKPSPITFMPSGISEDISMFLSFVEAKINDIRNVTGVNEVADGSTQGQDLLVKVMEGLNAATNNAIRPFYKVYYGCVENTLKHAILKWQSSVLAGDIDTAYQPLSSNTFKRVTIDKTISMYAYGMKLSLKPTQEQKQVLIQQASIMNQQQQIGPAHFFMLMKMIADSDIEKAQWYLVKAAREQAELNHKRQMELVKQQSMAQGQAAQMIEQSKMQGKQMEHQSKVELEKVKTGEELIILSAKGEVSANQSTMEAEQKLQNDIITNSMDKILPAG